MVEKPGNMMMHTINNVCAVVLIVLSTLCGTGKASELRTDTTSSMESMTQPAASNLAGTFWMLVKMMSMDDTNHEPSDPSKYTLEFDEDGNVALQSDCNHGTGTWNSTQPGHMQFGPIASTYAQCPPDSLSDKYLAQFEWVRSYVMKNGHLFLATMADGSVIEFEPMIVPVVATVLGEEIRTSDAEEMQQKILSRLFGHYAAANNLKATDDEVDKYIERMRQRIAADSNLTAENKLTKEEARQVEAMRREMARSLISQWKLNRALYQQYGGRIIFQQLGPEPLDAYRHYLEKRQAEGDFAIHEKVFEESFWGYFTNDSIHSFYDAGSKIGAFDSPPWQ